jgi:hypothetical protein
MPTREEIESEYNVVDGIIRSPGKFEGEPVYIVDFWHALVDGCGEEMEDETGVVSFELADEDYTKWPELDGYTHVRIREDSDGFAGLTLVKVSCTE